METTRFQVYKISLKSTRKLLILWSIMCVFGLWGILTIWLSENLKLLGVTIASYVLFLMQGFLGIVIALKNFKSIKYFVSWDDNEIQYQLPNNKEPEIIRIEDIQSVEKTNRDFRNTLKNNEIKNFSFNYFYFPTRQTIFEYFELVKSQAENGNLLKK